MPGLLCMIARAQVGVGPPVGVGIARSVPYFEQEMSEWCWAAAQQMALASIKVFYPQCKQADVVTERKDCCCPASGVRGRKRARNCVHPVLCGTPFSINLRSLGYDFDPAPGCFLDWPALKNEIKHNRTIIASWKWSGTCNNEFCSESTLEQVFSPTETRASASGHHFVVLRGYVEVADLKWVIVYDPAVGARIMTHDDYRCDAHHNTDGEVYKFRKASQH
jgi:hypothetical protein